MTTPGKSGSDSGASDMSIQPHKVGHISPLGIQASHLLSNPESAVAAGPTVPAAGADSGHKLEVTPVAAAPAATGAAGTGAAGITRRFAAARPGARCGAAGPAGAGRSRG